MLPVVQLDNKGKRREYWRKWYQANKEKSSIQARAWYQKNKEVVIQRSRDGELLRNFGITRQEYNRIFQIQGGMCKICGIHQSGVNKSLRVDHDHKTKKIRGLLCHNCNVSLGLLKENIETMKKMVAYLEDSCSR